MASTAGLSLERVARPATPPGRQAHASTPLAWLVVLLLPLAGLMSLLFRKQIDPQWTNPQLHFTLFLSVGIALFMLAFAAGEAAQRRGDARVLLISLAFLSTGGFLGLHALGTTGILFHTQHSGFKVAIPVGLFVSAAFAAASAFVDLRPQYAAAAVRHRAALRRSAFAAMAAWFVLTVADLPPLDQPSTEGATGTLLRVLAAAGIVIYAVSAARFWIVYRQRLTLLPAALIVCFILLAEALVGVLVTGERAWHASWWLWHALIVLAFLLVGLAARHEWHEERFRHLYLETTRESSRHVSVLFSDLAGFTTFAERSTPSQAAEMLDVYYKVATPLIGKTYGGNVEKFMGDGIMATFNSRGDQPDHARRAAGSALALQGALSEAFAPHPEWPRLRVGVNSGPAAVREMGGQGHVAYIVVGDVVNTGSRLENAAPVGGVLIGKGTYEELPDGIVVEPMPGLRVKGKDLSVDAFVLLEMS
ncbi:MAG: adenylate cyclase [Solirubrobacteraceae bacterium]|jgi:class 3 adenylate cyclase|nr:adenylate cyclase [Solirubrobacteraceae bacterium]